MVKTIELVRIGDHYYLFDDNARRGRSHVGIYDDPDAQNPEPWRFPILEVGQVITEEQAGALRDPTLAGRTVVEFWGTEDCYELRYSNAPPWFVRWWKRLADSPAYERSLLAIAVTGMAVSAYMLVATGELF